MLEVALSGKSPPLRHQVAGLENQLLLRRRRVRNEMTGIIRKVTAQLSTPVALLAAVGFGVAVEQASRHRGWSLATLLDACTASLGLLLSFSSAVQSTSNNAPGHRP